MPDQTESDFLELTAEIVCAYVSRNSISATDLPKLLADVHQALGALGAPEPVPEEQPLKPFVQVRKSITPDYLICLDDGKRLRSMKRHLAQLGMTPDEYRTKWGLPQDYPMVAANYAAIRSQLAKSSGLGRKAPSEAVEEPKQTGRRRKVAA